MKTLICTRHCVCVSWSELEGGPLLRVSWLCVHVTTKLHIWLYGHENLTVILHKVIIGYPLNELSYEMYIYLHQYMRKWFLHLRLPCQNEHKYEVSVWFLKIQILKTVPKVVLKFLVQLPWLIGFLLCAIRVIASFRKIFRRILEISNEFNRNK